MSIAIRPANEADLSAIHDIFFANEMRGAPNPPPRREAWSDLRHALRTGTMVVAIEDSMPIGFAAVVTRDRIAFLTDLFVLPDRQSVGAGGALLDAALAGDALARCTVSSTDPRALALYIRAGMQPLWPHFNLRRFESVATGGTDTDSEAGGRRVRSETGGSVANVGAGVMVVEARAGDPEILAWDTRIGGRSRPDDHAYWVREQRAVPLWFERQGTRAGYGYVRPGAGTLWWPEACAIGPVGVMDPADAAPCVLAAVDWARRRAETLLIDVPGPHPSLAPLLASGFRIDYVETYVSDEAAPFFDPRRYLASGSNLL